MYNYRFGGPGSDAGTPSHSSQNPDWPRRHSAFSLVALIAVAAVVAVLAIGTGFWLLGLVFHLAGLIVRIAIIAAVAGLVFRRVAGRCSRRRA